MKQGLALLIMLMAVILLNATAVVVNSYNLNQVLKLSRSSYSVDIENQIASVTLSETFKHIGTGNFSAKYNCPLPEGASPTQLRWFNGTNWMVALISPTPQDSNAVGPGQLPQYLKDYLGFFPLMFNLNMTMVPGDSVVVQLSYVQLLDYEDGRVNINLRNDYTPVQTSNLEYQSLELIINSERSIVEGMIESHPAAEITYDEHHAMVSYQIENEPANLDYQGFYVLSATELGLWAMSTYLDEVPDEYGNGFFSMIVEPDPSSGAQVINKYFTLIVDTSGSMMGTKIIQAKNAASYIVNNLNPGDYFNIVRFSSIATALWPSHSSATPDNVAAALTFINNLTATGGTDIGAAFTTAIPQYASTPDDAANIIIFLTDGRPTWGIIDTQQLLSHVQTLVDTYFVDLFLFNFGIGLDVDQQLLTLLSTENNGVAQFLGDDELEESITSFYNLIRNPVLLNPEISATPDNAFVEVYPSPLPNLYLGRQMIISGRYANPQPVSVHFFGEAFNQPLSYTYEVALSDSFSTDNQFLTRIWAKQKVEYLLVQYYSYPPNSL
ncbi:MAG: VWA domain-containing protein, partial [Candidatus Cloacimonetes bacterium]|nr:VWA domain-containing protein [Candidatus Cloacimonadota bacterium]